MSVLGFFQKGISFKQIQVWIVGSYFLITALSGFLTLTTSHGEFIVKLYFILIFLFSFKYLITEGKSLDWIFMFFLLFIILSSFVQNYNYSLFFDGLFGLSNMFFFLIARSKLLQVGDIIKKGIPIYVVVSFIGLILFILMPSWYLEWKMRNGHVWEEGHILEMTRLSSFWSYPYWISYGGAIIYTYILYSLYLNNNYNWKDVALLIYIMLILILAQQRTPLFWLILITIAYLLYKFTKGKVIPILVAISMSTALYLTTFVFVPKDYTERFIDKIEVVIEDASYLQKRTAMLSSFHDNDISFWGDGIGRYGHAALGASNRVITDQNGWKILFENGIFGCIGYLFFLLYAIVYGLKKRGTLFCLGIILFYLVGMFGANCLCNYQQYSPILWFCLGSLFNNNKLIT